MRRAPAILSLIPAGSQYPSTVPAKAPFPLTRYGAPIASPFLATGLDSSTIRFTIHSFTKPLYGTGGELIRPAEDQSHHIADAIAQSLGGRTLDVGGHKASIVWIGTNQLQDPAEADLWHAVANFSADVAG
ncbi:MAG: DUF3168 domain-containing protein [Candidatus Sphingomonas colombiensis]|nr:DUF3168 domain-containing protein [Sphingomonas sp.]WEK42981.1 MAG: DUF3168 domain-containing protein [Sphingomonas sp.]